MRTEGLHLLAVAFWLACLGSSASGQPSGGLQFDGVNDYVTFGQAPGLGVSQFTIETWFKRTGAGATASSGSGGVTAVPLMAKGRGEADGSNLDMNWFLGITSAGLLVADFEDMASGANHPATGTTVIPMNQWCHAAATYDGTTWRLYLNGNLETTVAANATPRSDSIQHASLATALTSAGAIEGYFAGVLDEARVWNYARSQAEIASGRYQTIATGTGLVGRWALDETSGTVADSTATPAIPGTLVNGPVWTTGSPMAPVPTGSLVSPADGGVVPGPTVTFTCQASDEVGLTTATLYIGRPAQTLTFSGPAQTEDTQIDLSQPNSNLGAATSINVDGVSPHAHGLIRFPNIIGTGPGQVPPDTTIGSATLRVNCSNPGTLPMKAYRMTMGWDENSATWNQASTEVSWPEAGADATSCHAAQAYDADCTATGWRSIDLTAIVQEWISGQPNHGIVLVDAGGSDGVDSYTSESGTPPELVITLQPAEPLAPVQPQTISGTNTTVTFNVTRPDGDYIWNCKVANTGGQEAWAGADFRLTVDSNYPDFPTLVAPVNGASGVATSPTLQVGVSDPNGGPLAVQFYGRPAVSQESDFTVVMLPDTQFYTDELYGGVKEMFIAQTQWIVNNREARNIVYVAQMGDVSNNGDTYLDEWLNATNALYRLETPLPGFPGGIPYGAAVGNHDQRVPAGDNEPTTYYNQFLGVSHFQGRSYYGGHYGNNNNNHYQLFSAGGMDFIVIYFEYDATPDQTVLDWADALLKTFSNRRAIAVTHYFLNLDGTFGTQGSAIYEALKDNPNLFLMLCGHNHGETRRTDVYAGNTVHTLLADYQGDSNGGDGLLRLLRFIPSQDKISVETYSPWLNEYETDADSRFELSVPMNGLKLIATQTGVASGGTASAVWPDLALGVTYEWKAVVTDSTGRTTAGPTWSFTTGALANSPPTVSIASPASGALFSPASANVTIEAVAADADGAVATVEFFSGSTSLGVIRSEPYVWTGSLGAGNHTLTAVATDNGEARTVSAPIHISVGNAPTAPSNLSAAALSSTEIQLEWGDNSADETGFEIYESVSGGAFSYLGATAANVTGALVTGRQPSTSYSYVVRAVNVFGYAPSEAAPVATPAAPPVPTAPSDLTAAPVSDTEILLVWTDRSTDETGFKIERSMDGQSGWTVASTVVANSTNFRDTGLTSGTVYYYRVSACNGPSCSAPAPMAAAAPFIYSPATGETPVAVTIVGALGETYADDGVYEQLTERLSGGKPAVRYSMLEHVWTFNVTPGRSVVFYLQAHQTVSSDGDQFRFAYSTDGVGYHDMLVVSATAEPTDYQEFVLPASSAGTLYVRVQDTDHTAGKSDLDTLVVDHMLVVTDVSPMVTPPAAPVLLTATPGDRTVTLTWTASAGATSYEVWGRTGSDAFARVAGGLTGASFTDTGLVNGATYEYYVVAVNVYGSSGASNVKAATPQAPTVVAPPTGLSATPAKRKITLNWTQSTTPGVTQNKIYRSSDGSNFTVLATIPARTTYSDSAATGTLRYYRVTAVSGEAESAPSNAASATAK